MPVLYAFETASRSIVFFFLLLSIDTEMYPTFIRLLEFNELNFLSLLSLDGGAQQAQRRELPPLRTFGYTPTTIDTMKTAILQSLIQHLLLKRLVQYQMTLAIVIFPFCGAPCIQGLCCNVRVASKPRNTIQRLNANCKGRHCFGK